MIVRELIAELMRWFEANQREMPWRGDEDPYRIWISEVMLQQTQVATVESYYRRWIQCLPTVHHLADSSLDDVLSLWQGLGYYSRARNLLKGARYIIDHYNGSFPHSREEALKIPGVGPYIAGAVLSIAYNMPVPAIDGNVIRVISRLMDMHDDSTTSKFRSTVNELLIKSYHDFSPRWLCQAWMELGALQCTPRPDCSLCPVQAFCKAFQNRTVSKLPLKLKSKTNPVRKGVIFAIINGKNVLMVRRPDHGLLSGLWELPNCMLDEISCESFCRQNNLKITQVLETRVNHVYSHFKVDFSVVKAQLLEEWQSDFWIRSQWVSSSDLNLLAKPGVHIKALTKLGF